MQNQFIAMIHPILLNLLYLVAALAISLITVGMKHVRIWLISHTNVNNRNFLESMAKEAYAHAEKWYLGQGGEAKLNAAVNFMMKKINLQAIGLTREDITNVIQKAWQDYNPGKVPTKTQPQITDPIPDNVKKLIDAAKQFNQQPQQGTQADTQPALAANEQVPQTPGTTTTTS